MIETERKEIDGVKYLCTQLPATRSLALLTRLTNMLGRPMLFLLAKGMEGVADSEVEDLAESAAALLFERLEEQVVVDTVKDILAGTSFVQGSDGDGNARAHEVTGPLFDEHFRGKLWTRLIPCVRWSLEVNYRDFFDAARSIGSLSARIRSTATGAASTGPNTSAPNGGSAGAAAS